MKFKIYDKQCLNYLSGIYDSKDECRKRLISYHNQDVEGQYLNKLTLNDLCEEFGWEIHMVR